MIEVRTVLDKKALDALSKSGLKNLAILLGILGGAIIVVGVSLLIMELDSVVGVALIVAGLIVPALMLLFLYRYFVKLNINTAKNEAEQVFVFCDKVALSEKSLLSNADNIEYDWKAFYKAVEGREYFYLYLNKFTAFIIDKNGFIKGSATELRDMLCERLDKKFSYPKN